MSRRSRIHGTLAGAAALYQKVADWNQPGATGYAVVRSRALARGVELAKLPKYVYLCFPSEGVDLPTESCWSEGLALSQALAVWTYPILIIKSAGEPYVWFIRNFDDEE